MEVSECGGEMLKKHHRVMLFKLFQQPPLLLGRQGLVGGDFAQKLLEALECGCLALVLILLWRHLLAKGECCNRERGKHLFFFAEATKVIFMVMAQCAKIEKCYVT